MYIQLFGNFELENQDSYYVFMERLKIWIHYHIHFRNISDAFIGIQVNKNGSSYELTADKDNPPPRDLIDSLWMQNGEPNNVNTTSIYMLNKVCNIGGLVQEDVISVQYVSNWVKSFLH